jgi:hypothetical protein
MSGAFLDAVRDVLGVGAVVAALYGLYVAKCALGIDIFRSGGLHLPLPRGFRRRFRAWRARRRPGNAPDAP